MILEADTSLPEPFNKREKLKFQACESLADNSQAILDMQPTKLGVNGSVLY